MKYIKRVMAMPARVRMAPSLKFGLLTLGSGAWAFGLVSQFDSSAAVMKYLLMSLLMAVVAIL